MLNVNYLRILEQTGVFRYISPEEYEKAVESLVISSMNFVNNQIIIRQNEKTEYVAIVISGRVKAEKIHGGGSDNMVHIYMPGDAFAYEGLLASNRINPMDYISDGDSKIVFVSIESIISSSFADKIIQGIVMYMADESIRRLYRIEIMSKKRLRDRIMTYLKIEESQIGVSVFALDISREQLAEYLCVNRSALSNELSKMKNEGIIRIDKRKILLKK